MRCLEFLENGHAIGSIVVSAVASTTNVSVLDSTRELSLNRIGIEWRSKMKYGDLHFGVSS
jgi:hypothetical protein